MPPIPPLTLSSAMCSTVVSTAWHSHHCPQYYPHECLAGKESLTEALSIIKRARELLDSYRQKTGTAPLQSPREMQNLQIIEQALPLRRPLLPLGQALLQLDCFLSCMIALKPLDGEDAQFTWEFFNRISTLVTDRDPVGTHCLV